MMEYVNFGKAGVKVSRLAYGLGFRGQSDADEAERVLEKGVELGLTFFDCANVYGFNDDGTQRGSSEQVLARVLKRHRDDLFISSKVFSPIGDGPNDRGSSRYHIMREIDRSLSRLETDHLDVYILHGWDESTPLEETMRALDDLVTAGKTRYVGVSNFQAWQVMKALWTQDQLTVDPLICIQNPYNLLNRALEQEMWPAQRDQGFGVMTYSPLGVGLLSGIYEQGKPPPAGTLYAKIREGQLDEEMTDTAVATLAALYQIAAVHGKTVAQTAINWVLSHPEVTVAITGGDTVAHMEENIGAVGWSITPEERVRLDEVSEGANRVLDRD